MDLMFCKGHVYQTIGTLLTDKGTIEKMCPDKDRTWILQLLLTALTIRPSEHIGRQ